MHMIERVARAIALTIVKEWDPYERDYVEPEVFVEAHWRDWEDAARAAIEAMREPSHNMMQAQYEGMFEDKWDGTQALMIGAGWESAIDAALQESKETEG